MERHLAKRDIALASSQLQRSIWQRGEDNKRAANQRTAFGKEEVKEIASSQSEVNIRQR